MTQAPGFRVVSRAQKTPQPIVPKESTSSWKSQKASPSAGECWPDPQTATVSPNECSFNTRTLFFFNAVHSKPGSDQGSPCRLDQVPSPGSLSSGSCTPLVKNEQKQVGALPCKHVPEQSFIRHMFTFVILPPLLPQTRRSTHISAEQKRRSHINIGFKTLCSLVPTLKTQSNVSACVRLHEETDHVFASLFPPWCIQISNAVTLQKTVEHIGKLQQERQQLQKEVKRLREEIEELNSSIK